jgi:starch phosphorylase
MAVARPIYLMNSPNSLVLRRFFHRCRDMRPTRVFAIVPSVPPELAPLSELAFNLRWCWDNATIDLFRRLDSDLWEQTKHNPVAMLGRLSQEMLDAAATDESFLAHLDHVYRRHTKYMERGARSNGSGQNGLCVAYFSAEYGLTDCLRIYAGGLGMLAGDILKSASDLNAGLVGVGILYQEGYVRQYLSPEGWQQELYEESDFHSLPIELERGSDGSPLLVGLPLGGTELLAQIWRVRVGRTPLYLLDTNISHNSPGQRTISARLYSADRRVRLQQEALLAIGGTRALDALGIAPTVFHMNEGHSALLVLERIRKLMREAEVDFDTAREAVLASTVFTAHTCVSAAIEEYPEALVEELLGGWYRELGLTTDQMMALGRYPLSNVEETFSPAILALRLSAYRNGVSKLHGEVTRRLWQRAWPSVPAELVPITSITNGVHLRSWASHDIVDLFDRYLGPAWMEHDSDASVWHGVQRMPAEELWRTHERRRERLVAFARRRVRAQMEARGVSPADAALAEDVLDARALTIGSARRFAAYKRGALIFRDLDRLEAILGNRDRPVQIIMAGKSHPDDAEGKAVIRTVVHHARSERLRRRVVFLEDYDMEVARYLVQGADVWLNTPRRPMEASGTSGMKATANGALNLSIIDGWWAEAYDPNLGWAIGRGEEYEDTDLQDRLEASTLYDVLEHEVVPLFYDRGPDGLPRRWISRMKNAMEAICPRFNTTRLVQDYTREFYQPASERWAELTHRGLAGAAELAEWKRRVARAWTGVRVQSHQILDEALSGRPAKVEIRVCLGDLRPQDVEVTLLYGRVNAAGEIVAPEAIPALWCADGGSASHRYEATIPPGDSGSHGFVVRVMPSHSLLTDPYDLGLVAWG